MGYYKQNDGKITIYALQFNPTKKIYIGSTNNLLSRYSTHISKLKNGTHHSKDLQTDFKEHDEVEDFSLYILEELGIEEGDEDVMHEGKKIVKRTQREYEWMKTYKTYINGYNRQDRLALKYINDRCVLPLKEGKPELPKEG